MARISRYHNYRNIDVDQTEDQVYATGCEVFSWYISNSNAATIYVKLYDGTAADVVVGTTTPTLTIPVPGGQAAHASFDPGWPFNDALTIAATTGVADNDTGAPDANDVVVNLILG